jgi:hypothetical protein
MFRAELQIPLNWELQIPLNWELQIPLNWGCDYFEKPPFIMMPKRLNHKQNHRSFFENF